MNIFGITIVRTKHLEAERSALRDRIKELKLAGWAAMGAWYRSTGLLKYEDNEKVRATYNFQREYGIFSHDKPIDGPSPINPNFHEYIESGGQSISVPKN